MIIRSPSVLFGIIIYRLLNSLFIQTTFVPDEVWQLVEVAHKFAFGYGSFTWEWLESTAIRSPIPSLLLAAVYKLYAMLNIDTRLVIIYTPRILHALLAALTDYSLYSMTNLLFGRTTAQWTLFSQLINWFNFYCGPRSLANCLECTLTTIAFNYFPWKHVSHCKQASSPFIFILVISTCVILRPTAALLWLPIGIYHFMCELQVSTYRFLRILLYYLVVSLPCLGVSILTERLFYGVWTISQLNFIKFNLLSDGASFYGVQSLYWYLSHGLPVITFSFLPFFLFGLIIDIFAKYIEMSSWRMVASDIELRVQRSFGVFFAAIIFWTIFMYSLLAHKEFRFLFPILPMIMLFSGRGIGHLFAVFSRTKMTSLKCMKTGLLCMLLVTQTSLGIYMSSIHQLGPNKLMSALGRQADLKEWASIPNSLQPHLDMMSPSHDKEVGYVRALFLMPCHTTPHLSFLHRNISLRLLDCLPDLSKFTTSNNYEHYDEAAVFYANPRLWLSKNYKTQILPHYISLFDTLLNAPDRAVKQFLDSNGYTKCLRIFHAHFPTDARHGQFIFVFCAKGWQL